MRLPAGRQGLRNSDWGIQNIRKEVCSDYGLLIVECESGVSSKLKAPAYAEVPAGRRSSRQGSHF
jgi:hypothetical protein